MSNLINALDNYTPKQFGENGSVEYTWSNNMKEKILQFTFQLVRTTADKMLVLQNVLRDILQTLKNRHQTSRLDVVNNRYLAMMFQIIAHTRDIIDGKGEYSLTYMMIVVWHDYFPELAQFALESLFYTDSDHKHPYGSFKDIKYFCQYCHTIQTNHPLIYVAVRILNYQIRKDESILNVNNTEISLSLAAKWAPRAKKHYEWLFNLLACDYYYEFLLTATSNEQKEKARKKCYTNYRQLCASLNRKLDTLQIKQCANVWSDINFGNVTSISFSKQKNAFMNTKNGKVKYPEREDRVLCAEKFASFIKDTIKEGKEIKGQRVGMENFTKQASELINQLNCEQDTKQESLLKIDLLDSQWRDNSKQTVSLGKMIAMVDVSGSMTGDPMNVAIALGIRIAEKSMLGKRVMTFSAKPSWVNLENCDGFVSQVEVVQKAEWGMNTNFYLALKTILDAIIENKMDPEDVQDLILVVLSDMQIDQAETSSQHYGNVNAKERETMYEKIKSMYTEAGMRVHGKPYKPPHLLFWNLRSSSGFPSLSSQPNVSMLSGFSASLLNLFCEEGIEALESITPWAQLERSLENKRYERMKTQAFNYLARF
jgi:hypothetical protein